MSKKNRARVRVLHPQRATRVIEVECASDKTTIGWSDGGPVTLTTPQLVTFAAFTHEERCAAGCDLEPVFARGDAEMRAAADRLWAQTEAAELRERRN